MTTIVPANWATVLTPEERWHLGHILVQALRDVSEEKAELAHSGAAARFAVMDLYGITSREYDELAAEIADLLTDDLLSVRA
ncbi:MAG: hypothetical protein M0030_03390 [Actinomycetota bacterium]|nr:hypothetical protein [Actinomycetota bacterium]